MRNQNMLQQRTPAKNICFYFQVHQPYRVSDFSVFDHGSGKGYFVGPEQARNQEIFAKVAQKCYLPANRLFLKLLNNHPELKISFSLSGVFLEQCLQFGVLGQKVLKSFQDLIATGQVELLSETFYHSLAALYDQQEFAFQIQQHQQLLEKLFGVRPKVFRNTELIYSNEIGQLVRNLGYKGILLEGWDPVLGDRSPNLTYRLPKHMQLPAEPNFGLLLKNYRLSDDIAFRFSNHNWQEHPMSVHKFIDWTHQNYGENINLFMDYETFGEHQWEESGIFEFLAALPAYCLQNGIGFKTPSEILDNTQHAEELDVHKPLSWADSERDLSAWRGNEMQKRMLERVYNLKDKVINTADPHLLQAWRKLQTSDHFYYMCTKFWQDGDVHKYFSPYESPYEAFINYSGVLRDLEHRIDSKLSELELRSAILVEGTEAQMRRLALQSQAKPRQSFWQKIRSLLRNLFFKLR